MKRLLKWLLMLSVAAAMGGCAARGGVTVDAAEARQDNCIDDKHPSGAFTCVREAAGEAWLYAQMSSHVYGSPEHLFEFPDYVQPESPVEAPGTGFRAQVFRVNPPGKEPYVVIAYQGTKGLRDWLMGNLNPTSPQARQGRELLKKVRAASPNTKITLTGHSLGGAISKFVVTREPGLIAHIFNPSVFVTSGPYAREKNLYSIAHYGEALGWPRRAVWDGSDVHTILPCKKDGPISRHSIRLAAECLTHLAAWESPQSPDSAEAQNSLELNGIAPRRRLVDNELVL